METKRNHLRHVDGLRAVAVLSVIFFHFGISGFTGGYVGVDIFFVISGFLITRIIVAEIEQTGRLSFLNFYKRRVRRLFPALLFVLLLTTVAGVVLLAPENLVQYGGSLAAAALSLSNVLFWFESGYFDTASHLKPLLHTWSLSVEEQFYLVWPLLLLLMVTKTKKVAAIVLVGLASFYLNYYFVQAARPGFESTIFFLAPFRGFEFALGAICVYLERYVNANRLMVEVAALLGIALITYSFFALDQTSLFPYFNALPCCIGTALIILSRGSIVSKVMLENKPVVAIGLLSYSLYLVHWPIYVFTRYVLIDVSSMSIVMAMFVASMVFATISYFCIEKPFRYAATPWRKAWVYKGALSGMVLMCLLGVALKFSDGWAWRYAAAPLTATQIEEGKSKRFIGIQSGCNLLLLDNIERCHMDRPIQILLFGNSHEPDGYNIFNYLYGTNKQVNIISLGTVNDCNFIVKEDGLSSGVEALDCARRFATLNNPEFINKLTHIVYSNHTGFEYVAKDLWSALANLTSRNNKIKLVVLGSYLETSLDCSTIRNKDGNFDACKKAEYVTYFKPGERAESIVPEVKTLDYLYISKFDLLCPDKKLSSCLTYANGEPMFYDAHHLSYGFARHLGDLIVQHYGQGLIDLGLPSPSIQ
ncbi:MAG: acyltransferase family protein [Cellvibrio sp.]|uniref:acyltransferase family protein n=1 Tax=Cellvibrio sp. TaxID=1965322 RepID=UPI002721E401|nr:acyltransferase family protein [Cellvibrio sp.]